MINRDLLLTAAIIFHDVGKTRNFHASRENLDYTDDGQLLGHIYHWY